MIVMEVVRAIRAEIEDMTRKVSNDITSGRAADYAGYKAMVGRIRGHQDALDAIGAVLKKNDEDVE